MNTTNLDRHNAIIAHARYLALCAYQQYGTADAVHSLARDLWYQDADRRMVDEIHRFADSL